MNAIVDKAINTNKRQDTIAYKELNTTSDEVVNINKKWDNIASKWPNAEAELSMLIKTQIIR